MKYVITGGAGNTSAPLVKKLLKAGHHVTVITRHRDRVRDLVDQGAFVAEGDLSDKAFIENAFRGADAVYTLCPQDMSVADIDEFCTRIALNYASAIEKNNIKHVVNLSAIGAHLPSGAGPVSAMHKVEQILNGVSGLNMVHIRAGYFYSNLMATLPLVKHQAIMGNNFEVTAPGLPMAAPDDIAAAAFHYLDKLSFTGNAFRHFASDEATTADIARIIGEDIGQPSLPWIRFSDDDTYNALLASGFNGGMAKALTDLGRCINDGSLLEDYMNQKEAPAGNFKLIHFAEQFAAAYHSLQKNSSQWK